MENKSIYLSIIVPCYNIEKYLSRNLLLKRVKEDYLNGYESITK